MPGNFYDSLNMISGLTWRKAMNAARVFSSYHLSRWRGKPLHRGMPVSLSVEPTTSCNLRCPECPSGLRSFSRPTGMLTDEVFFAVIDQLKKELFYLTFYFQGEPYLHPKFLNYVSYASENGIYTATSTNAHFLDRERAEQTVRSGLDRLIISIDGTDQTTYSSYRVGGLLDKVLEGTRNMVEAKKRLESRTPHLIFQFLVVRQNEHQVEEVRRLAREIGVDEVVLKTAQIYDYENGSDLIPENPKYSRYEKQSDGKFHIRNPLHNECWKMWQGCVITWDGRIVPCCFDKDGHHVMGNITDQPFNEIWHGPAYESFRRAILKGRDQIDICRNCTEGMEIWA